VEIVIIFVLPNSKEMTNTINLTEEQKAKLTETANTLFRSGTPSLRFMRLLHSDYQIYCNDDLNSPDDFYNMNREENRPMKDLLNILPSNKTMLSIANNHSLDKGYVSLQNTQRLLNNRSILNNGVKEIDGKMYTSFTSKGIKIGFYACTWGVNNPKAKDQDKLQIQNGIAPYNSSSTIQIEDIQLALQQMHNDGIEFKIISMHWGYEYEFYPRENIMKLAHQIAKAGANLIIGTHPHVFQGFEIIHTNKNNLDSTYHTTLVNYSLGNFCTSMYSLETRLGVIETLRLQRNASGKIEFTQPEFNFVYNVPHKGNQKRKLLFLDDYIIRYPKKANQKFIKRVSEIKRIP
jgi:hypothetical protein